MNVRVRLVGSRGGPKKLHLTHFSRSHRKSQLPVVAVLVQVTLTPTCSSVLSNTRELNHNWDTHQVAALLEFRSCWARLYLFHPPLLQATSNKCGRDCPCHFFVDAPCNGRSKRSPTPAEDRGQTRHGPASRLRQIFPRSSRSSTLCVCRWIAAISEGQNSSVLCVRGRRHFSHVRFGIAEAHSRAEIMELNFFSNAAFTRGMRLRAAMPSIWTTCGCGRSACHGAAPAGSHRGSRSSRSLVREYVSMPPVLTKALEAASDVPVDIDPIQRSPTKR